jgi:hypothetical protein
VIEMLATWFQVPSNVLYLARRTAGLGLIVVGSLGAAVVPSVVMPRDRIAWKAWATGYLADLPRSAGVPTGDVPARTGVVS